MDPLGVSIHLFLADGTPDGLRIVEKTNWSGVGLMFARSDLGEVQARDELRSTGVYVLLGAAEDSGLSSQIYVGEGDDVLKRLKSHQSSDSKDFWTDTIVFTSKDGALNKAHARYLESRLVSLASEAKRSELVNGNSPQSPPLSERDTAEAEGFLREMLIIFPVLGLDSFERAADIVKTTGAPRPQFLLDERGGRGTGEERSEGFIVFAGASARATETQSCPDRIRRLRATLLSKGVLEQSGPDEYRLVEDYVFSSPSNAAGVLCGASINGRTHWRDAHGKTLKEHQEAAASTFEIG